jgi:short-subunit dehydrogenase
VRAQAVCPGVVATDFDGKRGHGVLGVTSPEAVASASLQGLRFGETIRIPGPKPAARYAIAQ